MRLCHSARLKRENKLHMQTCKLLDDCNTNRKKPCCCGYRHMIYIRTSQEASQCGWESIARDFIPHWELLEVNGRWRRKSQFSLCLCIVQGCVLAEESPHIQIAWLHLGSVSYKWKKKKIKSKKVKDVKLGGGHMKEPGRSFNEWIWSKVMHMEMKFWTIDK